MKSILSFFRDTLTGGILFLLPVVLILVMIGKAFDMLEKISTPIASKLPNSIFGLDGSKLVAIALLIILCFLSGLMFRTKRVKGWISILEDKVLVYVPGYALIKAMTADAVGDSTGKSMIPVAVKDEEIWNLGFLVEETELMCTVFIPDAPRPDAGEIRLVPKESVKKLDVTLKAFNICLKNYGKGAQNWI